MHAVALSFAWEFWRRQRFVLAPALAYLAGAGRLRAGGAAVAARSEHHRPVDAAADVRVPDLPGRV